MTGWTLQWIGAQRMQPRTAKKRNIKPRKEGTFERKTSKDYSKQIAA
jgi:hypothetical protein